MPIDRRQLVNALYEATEKFVEHYNQANEAQVSYELEGDEIVIDGGGQHGLFTVSVVQD